MVRSSSTGKATVASSTGLVLKKEETEKYQLKQVSNEEKKMKKITILTTVSVSILLSASYFLVSKAQTGDKPVSILPQNEIKSDSQRKFETFDALIEKAQKEGSVRVIVRLNVENYKTEGDLNFTEKKIQREAIKKVQKNFEDHLADFNLKYIRFKYIPYILTEVKADALEFMKNSPEVSGITEDITFEPFLSESNTVIGNFPFALNAGLNGSGQTIVIIDSGVDKNHPFFLNQTAPFLTKVVKEACFSGFNGVNLFANCSGTAQPLPTPPLPDPTPSLILKSTVSGSGLPSCFINYFGVVYPIQQCEHGTHVAGIAAGNSGVASGANIISINTSSARIQQGSFQTTHYFSAMLLALEHTYTLSESNEYKIAAVNMSLGYEGMGIGFSSVCDNASQIEISMKSTIANLRSKGIAVIAASGNSNFSNATGSPACISNVVSVGSTGDGSTNIINGFPVLAPKDEVYTCLTCTDGSNSAFFLDLLAPGRWITSSVPGGDFANFSGTSMAAPHVAGAWAILKQRNPNVTIDKALQTLKNTGVLIRDPRILFPSPPRDIPRIQVNEAVAKIGATCVNNQISIGQMTVGQTLSNSDCSFSTNLNIFYDWYLFSGSAGQQVTITMNSSAFNTYLGLVNPNGNLIAEDDNSGGASNAKIVYTLPATGTYGIVATSNAASLFGAYTLTITQTNNIQVTINTNPSGRSFTVDGTTYNSPQTFQWQPGSSHTISTTSPQNGSAGNRYVWNNWSDGGAMSHMVSPTSNTTYTANFTTQHFLTMNAGTGGTVSPASNWYNAGQQVQISAAPGSGFNFSNWTGTGSGSYTGANNPATVTMNAPISQTANFSSTPACSYSVSPSSRTFNSRGGTGSFTVTAVNGCAWSVTPASWLSITSGATGSGNGTVNYSVPQYVGPRRSGTITVLANNQTQVVHTVNQFAHTPYDYDGDSRADISVFRPSLGGWYISQSSNNSFFALGFGLGSDVITPADFDGDGRTDIAVFRPSNGTWYLQRSRDNFTAVQFGQAGDIPLPFDFDGNTKADIAVFRPSTGGWYILPSSGGGVLAVGFGIAEDKPAVGDFDRDGKADISVFRPSTGSWYRLNSSNGQFVAVQFGAAEDKPVPADYDGDGRADIAVFRPSTGGWYILKSSNGEFLGVGFGIAEDKPVAADYDGDGMTDIAVFRPSARSWYLLMTTANFAAVQFGSSEDAPTPNAFIR